MTAMPRFAHHRPRTLDDALDLLATHGPSARVIAGGTDLVPRMRGGAVTAEHLVSVTRIAALSGVRFDPAEGLMIGAGAKINAVGAEPAVPEHYPALATACAVMATTQIRNMGTVAGNIANGSPCADTGAPLLVYDASVEVARRGAAREVKLHTFFEGPRQVDMQPDELIVAIRTPPPPARGGSAYLRLSARSKVDMAAVGVAAFVALAEGGRIDFARIALTSVAPTPLRCYDAEMRLAGQAPTEALVADAAAACARASRPITDVRATAEYRRTMVEVLARRVLAGSLDAARGTPS